MVRDPLKKSHGAFDAAVKGAGGSTKQGGDLQKLKDAVKKHPNIQANIPFEAWEEIYNAGMKAGMEGAKLAGAGGSPGQPYTPPKENPNNPYVPAPPRKLASQQIRPNHIMLPFVPKEAETDEEYGDGPDDENLGNQAHNVPDHSKGHYGQYGEPTSDPTRGINPGGGPVDLPHMEVPSEERQRREGDHMRKYHT
tara:strand:+ start:11 stop:595 length:585 start_codon:yes stop_codon:yes gene_type:complete